MSSRMLPEEFADLERFAEQWSLATERQRYTARLASSMPELQELYDAAVPRMADALAYLDQFELDDLPEDARNLMRLFFSVVNASFPVEAWKQPRVPDSGAAYLDLVDEPVI
ncbi:MAG: hypothetical protein F4Y27_05860 [Acidimicrobiaceae bacterium]|nr:hypothetical protein [Acidimicrobiaceae bacterium]MXW60856.1 hypothetical protein [Acidimicrobiaceae bacterium]MXW75094.1 hypothetical protein [Acidimicrobiaceae bacterium]MYA74181.1 hypothetical protein [Acidimicrobiaceae bacterium]MYC42475.1 hypothetical protein [Acidimicrobiaceae bacterium]